MMFEGYSADRSAQYKRGALPKAVAYKTDEIIPTNAQNILLANMFLVSGDQTGAPVVYIVINDAESRHNTGSVSIAGQLREIREYFGLNLSQLSKILSVSRPQLYKWLEGEAVPQREEFNQKIAEIYSLLNLIPQEHGKYFGKLAKRYISEKQTVFDVLVEPGLNREKLLAIYDSIKNDIETIDSRKAKERDKHRSHDASELILPPK